MEETCEVTKIQSATQARHILDSFAVQGGYKALSIENGFIVYGNEKFELTIKQKTRRRFDIIKRLKSV
jgi:hypothetical protein